jgi:hypothetical protein
VARITATGIAYEYASHDFAEYIFHDVAGWLMMPLALLLLLLELKILDWIYQFEKKETDPTARRPVPMPI